MKNKIQVVGAAIIQDGKILCAQRSTTMTLPMLWEFPGGKIEVHESPQQTLVRELKEEMNADIEVLDFVERATYAYDFGTVELTVYTAHLLSSNIELLEHHQVKWLKPSQLHALDWAPVDIPAVKKLSQLILE